MCPLKADETDAGMEAPATGLTPESARRIGGVFGSSLSYPTFFFGGVESLSFRSLSSAVDTSQMLQEMPYHIPPENVSICICNRTTCCPIWNLEE